MSYLDRIRLKPKTRAHLFKDTKPSETFYPDLHSCHYLGAVSPWSQKTSRKYGSTHGSHSIPLFFFFWLSFQWSLFLYLRKDYSLESELKRLRESSLGNMNQIEPKIKLSSLPLFQSCPLEYMSIKLFISVFLSDLFSGLSDPWNQVS